jgi:hypothetical protein
MIGVEPGIAFDALWQLVVELACGSFVSFADLVGQHLPRVGL